MKGLSFKIFYQKIKFWFAKFHTKLLIGTKSFRTRFDKKDGVFSVSNGTKYLVLFGPEKYDAIRNRSRYLTSQRSGITYVSYP